MADQFEYEVMRELELRDYFAAKAMEALIISQNTKGTTASWIAGAAYATADHMMEIRKERK